MGERQADRYELQQKCTLGSRIKLLRINSNVSREELSDYLGISTKVLYNYENDITVPSVKTLGKMALMFHVTTDYIIIGKKNG